MNNPLDGVRILDLTRLNPGAYCTMLLADMGADVLKIEQPGRGDYLRHTPPLIGGQSSMFLTLNRNKKSMTLNLKSEEGKEIFTRLLNSYDILVESFRPGVCKRLGIDYDTLKKDHPELIYCPITGFGQDGPYKNLVGHDINYLALSGILSLTGEKNGPPIVPGIPIADIAGSMFAVMGILLALISRQKTGTGQFVDISMFDGVVSWLTIQAADLSPTANLQKEQLGPQVENLSIQFIKQKMENMLQLELLKKSSGKFSVKKLVQKIF